MPIYAYKCSECGHEVELLQKLSDPPPTECPHCHRAALVKQVTAAGFQLKGSGWYATDFRNSGAPKKDAKADPSTEAAGGTKADGDSKSEAGTAAKSDSTAAPATPKDGASSKESAAPKESAPRKESASPPPPPASGTA
jgi:putative FmdB family regulatory protein